jgi:hypothetical protein
MTPLARTFAGKIGTFATAAHCHMQGTALAGDREKR